MELPRLIHAGGYFHAERHVMVNRHAHLGLTLRGIRHSRVYAPDGTLLRAFPAADGEPFHPRLTLTAPGCRIDFEYGPDRENYVLQLDFPALAFEAKTHQLRLDCDSTALPLPPTAALDPAEIPVVRETFLRIIREHASAVPRRRLTAEVMTCDLLLRFLRTEEDADDAVSRFRRILDEDDWTRPLADCCRELGIGRDTMRKKFFDRYRITPAEYRARRREQKIRELFAASMTLKEIAFAVGMKHPSHLSAFIRERCGKTPTELARELHDASRRRAGNA